MSSGMSSPRLSEAEEEEEESGWTNYFVDYEIRRIEKEEEEEEAEDEDDSISNSKMMMSRSASMLSDAGSGPEWKVQRRPMVSSIPRRLNMNMNMNKGGKMPPYDDSLEDTASSPVNSPKINQYFKTMSINSSSRGAEETFHTTYFQGKGNIGGEAEEESYNCKTQRGRTGLADKGYCLIPNTQLLNFNYYHYNFPPFHLDVSHTHAQP